MNTENYLEIAEYIDKEVRKVFIEGTRFTIFELKEASNKITRLVLSVLVAADAQNWDWTTNRPVGDVGKSDPNEPVDPHTPNNRDNGEVKELQSEVMKLRDRVKKLEERLK